MLASVRETNHRFTLYTDEDGSAVDDWFANHRVEVDRRPLPEGGPEPFVAVERDGAFVGVLPLAVVERLLVPPIVGPASTEGLSPAYRGLFEVLDETVYTSMCRRELLAVSREIEDRAYRVGTGTLHVGFQRLSVFRTQLETYRQLAKTGVTVHVYGEDDWSPPGIPGVTYHPSSAGLLDEYWVVAFDGGGDPRDSCGLVAREATDGYRGFWTDDPDRVAGIKEGLDASGDQSETEADPTLR